MGAIATVGVIVGAPDYPMLMGSMVMGPLAGFVIKKFDQAMDGRMPAGFEMLINNFSVGIFGMVLAIIGYYAIGPFMSVILVILRGGVEILINNGLLPLAAIFIEPAKVLFLNNAINHGIFTPIGIEQAAEAGKSIMYMLEANPGPGLGLLLAYWVFSKDRATKDSAPGAIIIQFLGGIHEIYFPYILMNPFVIIGPILGNVCADLLLQHYRSRSCRTGSAWFHYRVSCPCHRESSMVISCPWCCYRSGSILCGIFPDCQDGRFQKPGRRTGKERQHEG